MKKILVTGGSGFIGSHFISAAVKNYMPVTVLDRFSYAGRMERLMPILRNLDWNKNLNVFFGDLSAPISEWQAEQLGDITGIVHFASETMVDQSIKLPYPFIISNYFGMYHLLEYARKLPNLKKIVIVSTDEVYGPILKGKFKETDRMNPTNPYAATKAGADLLANAYFHSYGTPIVIVRTANNFGPWQHAEKVIPTAIRHAINGTEMTVYGDGKHRRCWLYAPDFAQGVLRALAAGVPGEVYHMPGHVELENIELLDAIEGIVGKKIKRRHVPDVDIRRGHDRRYGINGGKSKRIGWIASKNFANQLWTTVKWYQENPEWLSPKGSSLDR